MDSFIQPCRFAQISSSTDMTAIDATATASSNGWVLSLTMTFMPRIDETAVTGRVMAAITARRSAAIVTFVFVRAW